MLERNVEQKVSRKTITVAGEERPIFICELMQHGKRCGSTYTDEVVMVRHLARVHGDPQAQQELRRIESNARYGR
jgi:hypothetical protein